MCDISEWGTPTANVSAKPTSRGRGRGFMKSFGEEDIATTTANLSLNGNGASDFSSDPWGSSTDTGNYEQPRTNSRGCFKCGEDGHMGRDCPTGGGGRGRGCFKCGQEGHMGRECPTGGDGGGSGRSRACFNCGEEGHQSRECTNPGTGGRGGGGGGGSRACYKCGNEGHMSRECPDAGGDGGDKPRGCFNCGQEGHVSKECSEPPKAGPDGKPREVYIPVDISENADELFNTGISTGINFSRFQDLTAKVSGNNPPAHISRFEEAGLRDLILKNVLRAGYTTPTPIQKAAIPIVMAKRDLMACAQTGSGKTAAFLLPIIHNLLADGVSKESGAVQSPQAVIVAPTRELAIQIRSEANKFAYGSVLGVCIAYGGAQRRAQQEQITRGCNILVATTGRLKDYMDNGFINFSNLKFFVLDEADRMLDMGFMPDIKAFVDHPTMPIKKLRQTLLFSATFADEIQHLAAEFLNEYLFVSVGVIGCASSDVRQAFECVSQYAKKEKLVSCLTDIGNQRTLVFVESKVTADFIAAYLAETGFPTTSIHGDRLQSQREEALRDFKSGKRTILVATAVAARGLDIKGVEHVINYDLPQSIDEYVHRIGRTGRVGNTGNAMSFYDPDKDSSLAAPLVQILAGAQQDVPDFIQSAAESGFSAGGRSFSRDVRRPRGGGRGGRGREDVGGDSGWGDNRGASAAPLSTVEAEESWD